MTHADQLARAGTSQAFRANRIIALVMALATAATLLLLRPDLPLIYLASTAISVCCMGWAKSRGIFGPPCPGRAQNFAAYVSVSTVGFVVTLLAAPQMIEPIGSAVFIIFALVMAVLVLRAIVDGKWTAR